MKSIVVLYLLGTFLAALTSVLFSFALPTEIALKRKKALFLRQTKYLKF